MFSLIERLKSRTVRSTTAKNYLSILRHFNKFIIRQDYKPNSWEDRVAIFCAYLIQKGLQSSTIKSYISAIKTVLRDDGYSWDEQRGVLSSLTQACRLQNDEIKCRLPIQKGLLNLIFFELQKVLPSQVYLFILHRALFALAYFGLMRIGELTEVPGMHAVKASNIHMGTNKNKIKLVLYTSKTHGKESYPQKIKIHAAESYDIKKARNGQLFCPFKLVNDYLILRAQFPEVSLQQNLFLFRDGSLVYPHYARKVLRDCLKNLGLDPSLYDCHSFRIGHTCDMYKDNIPFSKICTAGHWRSNAVYKYLR